MYVFLMSFVAAAFFLSGAVVGAEVWEQSVSRECTSRGKSERVWGSSMEERGVKWIMAPLTRGCVMRSELVKRKKEVIQRPGVSKAKPWVLDEAAGFIVIYLPSKWGDCEFLIYLVLFYFFVLFCKAYLFPPLKECTRHTDDVQGNAWSLDVRICLQGGFLVGMP